MKRVLVRDLVLALSIANLLMMRSWALLAWPRNHYFLGSQPGPDGVAAAMLCLIALATLLFVIGRRMGRMSATPARRTAGWLALPLLVGIGLNGLRQQVPALSAGALAKWPGRPLGAVLAGGVSLALLWVLKRHGAYGLARAAERVAIGLAPLILVTSGQTLWQLSPLQASHYRDLPPAPSSARHVAQRRVLLVIFDGLDQSLLFDDRPAGFAAPVFDTFRAEALSWQNAYPPSCTTLVSLPSILTGRALEAAEPAGPGELRLTSDRGEPVDWAKASIFSRGGGTASALIGWYHPYCRILGNQVSRCAWLPYFRPPALSVPARARDVALGILETVPGVYRIMRQGGFRPSGVSVEPTWHVQIFRTVHAETLRAVGDDSLDFVVAHYPIPHEPYVFDRQTGRLKASSEGEYVDNLALADRTLGELLSAVGSSARASETTIIVSADHGLRRPEPADRCVGFPTIGNLKHRVPLLIRFPRRAGSAVRQEVLRTSRLGIVATGVLDGSVRDGSDAAAVLQGN